MVIALVDDLMFSSKIKSAAGALGVDVVFARSAASALLEMQKSAPSLVIVDLNATRMDPLGTVAAMKEMPTLAGVPTVGFVSHVHTDLIEAARQAGINVMPRSAFTARLGDILRGQV
jgi:PleD family two-component response regulator